MKDKKHIKEAQKIVDDVCKDLEEILGEPVKKPKVVSLDDI